VEAAIAELGKAAGPVLGSLIVLLILTCLSLTAYIKSQITQRVNSQEIYNAKLAKVYEERVQEAKAAVTAIQENTVKLVELGRVLQLGSQSNDRMILVLDKVSNDMAIVNSSRKEYILRLESLIRDNKDQGIHIENQVVNVSREVKTLFECCKKLETKIEEVKREVKN
jgi:myosin heavy subunit